MRADAVPTSPPFGFPLYGLDPVWPGPRWLELFGDQAGDAPRWAVLGQQSTDGRSLVLVESCSRAATDELAAQWGEPPLQHVAARAATRLVDLTLPAPPVPRPEGFLPVIARHAADAASRYPEWQQARWQVNDAAVLARVWFFADGWAAISGAVDEVYLSAVGVSAVGGGIGPAGLSLARLRDGAAYHFQLDRPLYPGVLSDSRRAAGALTDPALWRRQDWHADQIRLMSW